jgi:hypothetical protein
MTFGPVRLATVEAASADEACNLAYRRVTCYANQCLTTRLVDEVDQEEQEIDSRFILE